MRFFTKPYRREALICLLLATATLWLYAPVRHYDFVNYDDNLYVHDEPMIAQGLSFAGVVWAFTHAQAANWHPLTGLSLMLDATLYRSWPGGFHLTNVLLHAAAAIALFLILRSMTGSLWRSAFVAALFAFHPLRVESVAWISERKDVLSGLFFMLTLGTYLRYVRSQKSEARDQAGLTAGLRFLTSGSYWLTFVFFTLGLMSKPMLVTLPFVLLLLDFWPLGRVGEASAVAKAMADRFRLDQQSRHKVAPAEGMPLWRLILEKLPLGLLSLAACAATVLAQDKAIVALGRLPLLSRIGYALMAYGVYIRQLFRPVGLAPFYPYLKEKFPSMGICFSLVLLPAVSVAAWAWRKKHPYFITGWLWYLGMLVPVIGIIQVGLQAHADRYTYLPQIGLYIMMVWVVTDWLAPRRFGRAGLAVLAAAALAACAWATSRQIPVWENSKTLFKHALQAGHESPTAHTNLGRALSDEGRTAEAMEHYRRALQMDLGFVEAHNNLGASLAQSGRLAEAEMHYREAIRLKPNYAEAHNNLGVELMSVGKASEALEHFQMAVQFRPGYADAFSNLGSALATQNRIDEAVQCFREALRLKPDCTMARDNLQLALLQQRQGLSAAQHAPSLQSVPKETAADVVARLREVLAQYPDNVSALNNLAWRLATAPDAADRDGAEAVRLAGKAVQLSGGNNSALLDTLAAAYAEAGRFDDAVKTAERAAELARAEADGTQVQQIENHIELYRQGRPCRQP